ncbi:MAG TPA: glycosyltransferase 87 family protein [Candidatus Limnocylindrales bacterium]
MRAWSGARFEGRRRWLVLGPAILILALVLVAIFRSAAASAVDVYTYLAAGERLNAGHELYALGPGDRPVLIKPPEWTVPLLSPPLIAVIWRPLAALPGELGLVIWWTGTVAATIVSIVVLYERRKVMTAVAVAVLAVPLTVLMGVGNLDGFRILATIAVWLLARQGRIALAAALIGPMAVLKLTPAILGVWLAVRKPAAIVPLVASAIAALAISIVGAGVAAHLEYLDVVGDTYQGGTWGLSLAGLARLAGLPPDGARIVQYAGTALFVVVVALLARRAPGASFSIAVIATAIASPSGGWHTLAILIVCLAPVAWPWDPRATSERSDQPAATSVSRTEPAPSS